MALFQNCGLFWQLDNIDFGTPGGGGNRGKLLGIQETGGNGRKIDFAKQIGVYALYADFTLLYVGQVGGGDGNRLLSRLRAHASGSFKGRWNRFSWFGIRRVLNSGELSNENDSLHPSRQDVLNHMEGIVVQFAEPPLNGQEGRFGNAVTRYVQIRDERLGPDSTQILKDIHSRIVIPEP